MRAEGVAGPQILQDGKFQDLRLAKSGELVFTELHGKYFEQTYRGNVFVSSMTAAVALNTANNTSLVPLGILNPQGSGKNIVMLRTVLALATLPGTQAVGGIVYRLATGVGSVTAATLNPIQCCLIGSGDQPVAKVYSSGSIVGGTLSDYLPIVSRTGASNPAASNTRIVDEFDGMIVLTPGAVLNIQEPNPDTTSNFTAVIGYMWEEVPI